MKRASTAQPPDDSARVPDPAWRASNLEPSAYRVELEPEERAALLLASECAERPWTELTHRDVPAECGSLWARVHRCLDERAGFCLVSGLPPTDDDEQARRLAFLAGLGLGTPVFQDARGARMVDIRSSDAADLDAATYKPRADGTHVRPYETRNAFRLHADACDVAGLFCVRSAARGGGSSIVSALAIHDHLADARPDLLALLYEPYYYARPRKPGEAASFHGIPVFSWQRGYFKGHIVPDLILAAQLVPEVPRLTTEQREALDTLLQAANSPEFTFTQRLAQGELLLLNNHLVWHGREAYEDTSSSTRHLLRLWLATANSRPLHPVHAAWFGSTDPGALRGGYLRERLGELTRPR